MRDSTRPSVVADVEVWHQDEMGWDLRVTLDDEGDPWFVAADAARHLGYRSASDAVRMLDDDEDRGTRLVRTPSGDQVMVVVSEEGLYTLAMRSRLEKAKPFRKWVAGVIKRLRRDGRVSLPGATASTEVEVAPAADLAQFELPKNMGDALVLAGQLWHEKHTAVVRAELAEAEADELRPAASAWTVMADAEGDWSVREAAQALNNDPNIATGETRLFRYLRAIRWLGTGNMPYQSALQAGRMRTKLTTFFDESVGIERVKTQPRLTLKGITELHRMLGGTAPLQLTKQPELMAGMP